MESERDQSDSGRSAEDCGGANCSDEQSSERREDSDRYDEGEQSPSRKRQKID